MATPTLLLQQTPILAGGSTSPVTLGSITVTAGQKLYAYIGVQEQNGTTDPVNDITLTGGGLTWTARGGRGSATPWSNAVRLFTATVSSGATISNLQVNCGSRQKYAVNAQIVAWANAQEAPVQIKTGDGANSGATSLTLDAAPASANAVHAACCANHFSSTEGGVTPGAGWTELGDDGPNSATINIQGQWRTGSTSTSVAWAETRTTGSNANYKTLLVAAELAAVGGAVYDADAIDALTLGDSATALAVFAAAAADALTPTDAATALAAFAPVAADAIALTDTAAAQAAFAATGADALALVDVANTLGVLGATATDAAVLTDAATTQATFGANASDAATLTDTAAGGLSYAAAASDAITLADDASAAPAVNSSATDALTPTDSASAGMVFACSATDGMTLADSASAGAVFACGATDVLALADAGSALAVLACAAGDAIALADAAEAGVADPDRSASDAMDLQDLAGTAGSVFYASAIDAMSLSDAAEASGGTASVAGGSWIQGGRRRRSR